MVGKRVIEAMCRIRCTAEVASEFRYENPIIGKKEMCIRDRCNSAGAGPEGTASGILYTESGEAVRCRLRRRGEKTGAVSYTHLDVYKRQVCILKMLKKSAISTISSSVIRMDERIRIGVISY